MKALSSLADRASLDVTCKAHISVFVTTTAGTDVIKNIEKYFTPPPQKKVGYLNSYESQ
jgi:hypothetical protein